MKSVYFPEHAGQLAISNTPAFKEGAAYGPCLTFQKQHAGYRGYCRKAMSIWKKQA